MGFFIKKGQSGLEFMMLSIFLLLLFTSSYSIIHRNSVDAVDYRRNYLAGSISEKIAYETNMAVTSGTGYFKRFYIPYDIYGLTYNITFSRRSVFVDWVGNSQAAHIVTSNFSGTFIKGYNYIENKDGVISLNPAYTQAPEIQVSYSPKYPRPEDDITIQISADDSYNGNRDIYGCYLSFDSSTWNLLNAVDGIYDEPIEVASTNIGNRTSATYTYYARCNDTDGYEADAEITFRVSLSGSGWWDSNWRYRIPVNVTGDDYTRNDYPVKVRINFTQRLIDVGDGFIFDNNSIRAVEWDDGYEVNVEVATNYKEITKIEQSYPDLWDMTSDSDTTRIDFTGGLNQTGNSFGVSDVNDGWDWTNSSMLAPYGHNGAQADYFARFGDPDGDSDFDTDDGFGASKPDYPVDSNYIAVIIGNLEDDANTGEDILDSGAWGIKFYIDAQMYSAIEEGGKAYLSFDYYADDLDDDLEEGAWIKARFGNSTVMNYLGSDLDTGHTYSDATPEIWASVDDPNNGWDDLVSGVFEDDVSPYITGSDWYYLDFGGKVDWMDNDSNGHSTNEGLGAYFDNIELMIKKETSMYDQSTNATIDVHFLLDGNTDVGETRYYYVYFGSDNDTKNASALTMDYDAEYLHIGYYYTNVTKMENALESLRTDRWINSWTRTNTGTVSPNIKESTIDQDVNVVILGQSDSPTMTLDSWVQDNNTLIIFSPSKDLSTDLPIYGYSSSNHQKYDDLDTTVYTKHIEYELSRNSMNYGSIDQGIYGIRTQSCVEADEGDNQVMISYCDYYGGAISLTNYPSTASETSAYPSAKEDILERYLWKLLFERSNLPAISVGSAEEYSG
ncbi:MAG: hypothetical protein GQ477_06110 [Nanohaloarchaea archaeon]|nr:hypothetical protein [Candidatus Nanohaloarchaea archaeon]